MSPPLSQSCLCANVGVKRDIGAGREVGNPDELAHCGVLWSGRAELRTGYPEHSNAKQLLEEAGSGVEHVCHRGEKDIAFERRFPAPTHGGILKQGLST